MVEITILNKILELINTMLNLIPRFIMWNPLITIPLIFYLAIEIKLMYESKPTLIGRLLKKLKNKHRCIFSDGYRCTANHKKGFACDGINIKEYCPYNKK